MSSTELEELQNLLPKDPDLTRDFKKRYQQTLNISVSGQITILQWSLRIWMAQRIVLLILTGLIGYALYYYFSHQPSESRNIFSALSKVNKTIQLLPWHISEEDDEFSEIMSEDENPPPSKQSYESLAPSPAPPHFDEPLDEKPIQSLIEYPPQKLFDALEKTSATSLDLWWHEDKKLIDETVDYWRRHTPPSQVSQLIENITQPMKKIYRLLALRYHPDKVQNPSTDQEKSIFQLMTDCILRVGERLDTKANKTGLANRFQGNTYANIMRDFLNLQKESKQQLASIAKLERQTEILKQGFAELVQDYAEVRQQSDQQNQQLDALEQENERKKQRLAALVQENERQKQRLAAIGQENERQKQQLAAIGQENERQIQRLAAIGQENERQKQDLLEIDRRIAQAGQHLADIEKQMAKKDEIDKKNMDKHNKYHAKKLARWQQKLVENPESLAAICSICFHSASLDPNHPLIDTYFPRYHERKNENIALTSIGQIIMWVIGLEYFIRIDEPEQAQGMFDAIANFEGKEELEDYQFLFERAEEKMKTLKIPVEEERSAVTPM